MTFKAPLDLTVHAPDGMYDPANEHDACGVGMVTTLNKRPERKIVTDAIEVLVNLDHRGAVGAEENTGDGAGILMSMPDEFMRATVPAELPEAGHYAAGIAFLDRDIETSGQQEQAIAKIVREEGLEVLAWRVVPTNPDGLGLQALGDALHVAFLRRGAAQRLQAQRAQSETAGEHPTIALFKLHVLRPFLCWSSPYVKRCSTPITSTAFETV